MEKADRDPGSILICQESSLLEMYFWNNLRFELFMFSEVRSYAARRYDLPGPRSVKGRYYLLEKLK